MVTTTDGMVAKLKSAFLDIDKGTLKSDDPGRYPDERLADYGGCNDRA